MLPAGAARWRAERCPGGAAAGAAGREQAGAPCVCVCARASPPAAADQEEGRGNGFVCHCGIVARPRSWPTPCLPPQAGASEADLAAALDTSRGVAAEQGWGCTDPFYMSVLGIATVHINLGAFKVHPKNVSLQQGETLEFRR